MAGQKLGLIVNPIAGMGGSVGLKGTDTAAILSEARARGAEPQAAQRAAVVLDALAAARPGLELLCAPGEMGERIARDAGLRPIVVGAPAQGETGAADTRAAAEAMAVAGARLILFAGGDGTARDMAAALDDRDRVPVIGVPAGVKMHSAVYATSPRAAADLALRALTQDIEARPREVMDIDEEAFRAGAVSARLYGYMPVPYAPDLTQNVKAGGVSGDREALCSIAAEIAGRMEPGRLYILGPGTTTRAVMEALHLPKTLLGVDLVRDGALLVADATEGDILRALAEWPTRRNRRHPHRRPGAFSRARQPADRRARGAGGGPRPAPCRRDAGEARVLARRHPSRRYRRSRARPCARRLAPRDHRLRQRGGVPGSGMSSDSRGSDPPLSLEPGPGFPQDGAAPAGAREGI